VANKELKIIIFGCIIKVNNFELYSILYYKDALHSVLQSFAVYGTAVRRLFRFIDAVGLTCIQSNNSSTSGVCSDAYGRVSQTLQAFAVSVSDCIQSILRRLSDLERIVCKQGDTLCCNKVTRYVVTRLHAMLYASILWDASKLFWLFLFV